MLALLLALCPWPEELPPADDGYRWPPDEWIQVQADRTQAERDRLRAVVTEGPWTAEKWGPALAEAERVHDYYVQMLHVGNPTYDPQLRRQWLGRMREIAGEERYWRGWLP